MDTIKSQNKKNMSLAPAIKKITKSLESDPDYRESWRANIAVQFQDEVRRYKKTNNKRTLSVEDIHKISNTAAEEFLKLLCK